MLELPGQGFQTTVITMLRALMDKADSIQEHMGNAGREVEILRKTSVCLSYFPEPWNLKKRWSNFEQCCPFLNVAESSFSLQSRILLSVHSFKRYYGAFVTCSALCLEAGKARENYDPTWEGLIVSWGLSYHGTYVDVKMSWFQSQEWYWEVVIKTKN